MSHTLPLNFQLDAMTAADFATVANLGEVIWRSHYANIVSDAQIDYMLAGRYTPEKLNMYLNAKDRWLMLLRISNSAVGYCSYALTNKPNEMKLEQLYVLPELHRGGLGGTMLHHIEDKTRALRFDTLMLQVNKRNTGAIAFYRNAGFAVREETVFDIGNGFVMDDYVMEKSLSTRKNT